MINGYMKKIEGKIKINGKKACLLENFFFTKTSIRDNIAFYNDQISQMEI